MDALFLCNIKNWVLFNFLEQYMKDSLTMWMTYCKWDTNDTMNTSVSRNDLSVALFWLAL